MRLRWKLAIVVPFVVAAYMLSYWLAGGSGWRRGTAVVVFLRNGGEFRGRVAVDSPLGIVLDHPALGRLWWSAWEVDAVSLYTGGEPWAA